MYVTSFRFRSKFVREKAKKSASYGLAIYNAFLKIFYMNFFRREFWIFSNEHFDRLN